MTPQWVRASGRAPHPDPPAKLTRTPAIKLYCLHHRGPSKQSPPPLAELRKVFTRAADCTVCGRGFGAQIVAETHAIAHAGWVACTECGETMPQDEFALHKQRRHTRRGYECHCGAAFYTQSKLEEHTRDIHTGPFYRCGRCLRVCKDWTSFMRHVKTTKAKCKIANPLYRAESESASESDSVSDSVSDTDVSHRSTMQSRQHPVLATSSAVDGVGDGALSHKHLRSE